MEEKIIELTNDNFDNFLKEKEFVIVDFWAPWCMPCRMVSPIIENLSKKYEGKVSFGKLNVDQQQDIAVKFGIMSIPTIIIFQNGKEVDRIIGAMPEEMFEERIKGILK
ncbi:MAG TPA: thioredoxin [Candidatus Ratteibacteria bacterium]|nr:thioredoxin [Candidatus Ratteibacteria bacterium]